ncbi:MAG: hypothetical protein ACK4M7_06950 [Burkholderiales bacterium]
MKRTEINQLRSLNNIRKISLEQELQALLVKIDDCNQQIKNEQDQIIKLMQQVSELKQYTYTEVYTTTVSEIEIRKFHYQIQQYKDSIVKCEENVTSLTGILEEFEDERAQLHESITKCIVKDEKYLELEKTFKAA